MNEEVMYIPADSLLSVINRIANAHIFINEIKQAHTAIEIGQILLNLKEEQGIFLPRGNDV